MPSGITLAVGATTRGSTNARERPSGNEEARPARQALRPGFIPGGDERIRTADLLLARCPRISCSQNQHLQHSDSEGGIGYMNRYFTLCGNEVFHEQVGILW